jgi:DNA polymerase III subunit epsilon
MNKFAIIDVETTGGSPATSKITEIAILVHDGEKVVDEFVSLVNPECEIPKFVVHLTGITQDMVAKAPKFYELAKRIIEITEDCIFVAHNVGFDYGMIRREFKSLGYDYRRPHLCTVRASRHVLPGHESYSLGKLARALNIKVEGRHRAGGDAQATAELFSMLVQADKKGLTHFIQDEINPKILHPNLNLETLDELPAKTGVYYFFDENNRLIYIGKSTNIKKRVEQHLRNQSTKKAAQMRGEISRIEHTLTGSELIALLLESKEIKKQQPVYNRMLRKSRFTHGLFAYFDQRGYTNFIIDQLKNRTDLPLTTFTTLTEAKAFLNKLTDNYTLCQKLNGLYQSSQSCFRYHTRECKGACIGEEDASSYNSRVERALKTIQFESDHFFILDKGRARTEKSIVLVENGSYIGYGYLHFTELRKNVAFWKSRIEIQTEDRDDRSIIQQFLRKAEDIKIRNFHKKGTPFHLDTTDED